MQPRTRPTRSFEQFKAETSPDTAHTAQTYAAFQLPAHYVPVQIRRQGVGAVFQVPQETMRELPGLFTRDDKLRITAVNDNWVWAVDNAWDENFWE